MATKRTKRKPAKAAAKKSAKKSVKNSAKAAKPRSGGKSAAGGLYRYSAQNKPFK